MRNMIAISFGALLASTSANAAVNIAGAPAGEDRTLSAAFDVTDGFGSRAAGTVSIQVVRYNYQNGDGNKVHVFRSNTAFAFDYDEGSGVRINCPIGGGGYLAARAGDSMPCTVSKGNGGANMAVDVVLRLGPGVPLTTTPAVGTDRTMSAPFDLTNGFGHRAAGVVRIALDYLNYGNGEGRKVVVFPSNNAFNFTYDVGSGARISCPIGGGGYLAVKTGNSLACTVSSGNGGARVDQQVILTLD